MGKSEEIPVNYKKYKHSCNDLTVLRCVLNIRKIQDSNTAISKITSDCVCSGEEGRKLVLIWVVTNPLNAVRQIMHHAEIRYCEIQSV